VEGAFDVANISLSISSRGIAPQLTATHGPPRRGESWWIACAQSSLPVPAFAGDEDGGATRRGVLDHVVDRAHRQRGADQPVEFPLLGDLAGRREGLQRAALQRVAHGPPSGDPAGTAS